jgi:hypothetical protein
LPYRLKLYATWKIGDGRHGTFGIIAMGQEVDWQEVNGNMVEGR